MSLQDDRRSYLVSMSLTELAFIVVFIVLLLFAVTRNETEARQEEHSEVIAQKSELIESHERFRKEVFEAAPKDVRDDDDLVRLVREEVPALRERNRELTSELREAEARADVSERKLEHLQATPDEKTAAEAIAQCEEDLEDCGEERVKLQGQMANLTGRGGIDYPPCWPDPTSPRGRPEYIYNIFISDDEVSVEPGWPLHRTDDVDEIPGARALAAASLTLQEFSARAEPVLEWSKRQNPECRHYVRIYDRAETKAYKDNRLQVEEFFYKYEVLSE